MVSCGESVCDLSNRVEFHLLFSDLEWVCFDISRDQTAYVLYDSRVVDGSEPDWLVNGFADQHQQVTMLNACMHAGSSSCSCLLTRYLGRPNRTEPLPQQSRL